jgi:hypothetical protein
MPASSRRRRVCSNPMTQREGSNALKIGEIRGKCARPDSGPARKKARFQRMDEGLALVPERAKVRPRGI